MLDGFLALEVKLRAKRADVPPPAPAAAEAAAEVAPDCVPMLQAASLAGELASARLAALEAYERAVPRLLETLARDVLARELALAPPDIAALARALANEYASEEPVAFVVAREDASRLPHGMPVRVDPRLRAGDIVLEVRDGEIDARFTLRLRDALGGLRS